MPAGTMEQLNQAVLPSVDEFATEIARAAVVSSYPDTGYVGGADYLG